MALVHTVRRFSQRNGALLRVSQLPLSLSSSSSRRDEDQPQPQTAIRSFHSTPQRDSAILLAGLGIAGTAMSAKYVIQVRNAAGCMCLDVDVLSGVHSMCVCAWICRRMMRTRPAPRAKR